MIGAEVAPSGPSRVLGILGGDPEDLLATGIPNEKIKIDKEQWKIRVMVPNATKREIIEILNRHDPAEVH